MRKEEMDRENIKKKFINGNNSVIEGRIDGGDPCLLLFPQLTTSSARKVALWEYAKSFPSGSCFVSRIRR